MSTCPSNAAIGLSEDVGSPDAAGLHEETDCRRFTEQRLSAALADVSVLRNLITNIADALDVPYDGGRGLDHAILGRDILMAIHQLKANQRKLPSEASKEKPMTADELKQFGRGAIVRHVTGQTAVVNDTFHVTNPAEWTLLVHPGTGDPK